ncbi:hypothetical protein BgiMline_017375 [Biomphalaria glabrata]|nr:hypothetical protein BgiMline_005051 [Biomphalaria glabrata]
MWLEIVKQNAKTKKKPLETRSANSPTDPTIALLRFTNGLVLLASKSDIINLWTELYGFLFSDERVFSEKPLADIPQDSVQKELYNFTASEVRYRKTQNTSSFWLWWTSCRSL